MLHITPIPQEEAAGTSLKGYLYANYTQMVLAFGIPHNEKCEWTFQTPSGKVFTLYPTGQVLPNDETIWNVGGDTNTSYVFATTVLIQSKLGWK